MTDLPARRAMRVQRDDLSRTELVDEDPPTLGDSQALLRVDVVGLSTNTEHRSQHHVMSDARMTSNAGNAWSVGTGPSSPGPSETLPTQC